ncbi:MAG TPA: hypothetical protein VK927_00190, partial [Adhaeribacter sp.]|nr:hypothetical protein [Adhaeribacter sp.]
MKKSLRHLVAAFGAAILAAGALQTQASHVQGSELTYTCIAPNMYVVNLKLYRDCSGATAPTTASLVLKSQGCNNGRSQAMTKVGGNSIGNLYCPQLGAPTCIITGNPNYEEVVLTTTVTFSAAETQCADWLLSWSLCCRPSSANIQNAQSYSFYTEAYLNLGNQATGSINNSSPQFNNIVVPYVNQGQPIILSSNAIDSDGDSLVYSLQAPLDQGPVTYSTYNGQGGIMVNPQDSSQFIFLPNGSYTYTPTFPMPSYTVDWSVPNPVATPSFGFDPQNGSLAFTPSVYQPSPSNQGLNKYVVVVQVDEFRKIGGIPVKVGTVRRDMFITVVDCGPNQNPVVTAPVANGMALTPGT